MEEPAEVGDWKKISVLGSGAFGSVVLWKNIRTNDFTAIKKCKFQKANSLTPKQRERWHNEVQIMKSMKHPNVISFKLLPLELESVLLKHNPTKLPLLSMEYCTKGNLRHVLREPKNSCGLKEQDIRYILQDILNGLSYLHNLNITHRDIKPDNIVLEHCNNRKGHTLYKIIDLGYAKELNDAVVSFVGTLHYLAPEIFLTQQYNNSVDYWSMGILTFEIICGVLPFMPDLGPFERFKKIKEKGPEDICIYMSYSGSVNYSTEIKKEHHISHCFKQYIENWLKHVLEMDPAKRSMNFPKGLTVFQYLNDILKKRIINVFSIYKLEFYSYEINESTLLSTLKDWISRDIKVPKNDLILIFNKEFTDSDDTSLVVDLLQDKNDICVFKRSAFVSDGLAYNFPKLVKELFKPLNKFNGIFVRDLYLQTIFYISVETNILSAFKISFNWYLNYFQNLCDNAKKKCVILSKEMTNLLMIVECFNNLRKNNVCDIDLRKNVEYRECLIYFQRLLSSLERSLANLKTLQKKIAVLLYRCEVLKKLMPDMEKIVESCKIPQQLEKIVVLSDRKKEKNSNILSDMKEIIADTIKYKDKLFRDKKLQCYAAAIANVINSENMLLSWMNGFSTHIRELSKAFEQSEIKYRDIAIKASEKKGIEKSTLNGVIDGEILKLPTTYLIQENQTLRCQFEGILTESILSHKKFVENTNSLGLGA